MKIQAISHAIDAAVEYLLPKGSCSRDRWLEIARVAHSEEGDALPYLVRYRACTNYVEWQGVLDDGIPHTLLERSDVGSCL